jgi:hypothetical protein
MAHPESTHEIAIKATRNWLERAVIGLNLCPFAKSVHVKKQIRYVVSDARDSDKLLDDLERECQILMKAKPEVMDMTLLIHPYTLTTFAPDFVDFLDLAEVALKVNGLTGILQIASFHPEYRFADTADDDITNYTNRSPYPTLHLIREASLARAVENFPDPASIYEKNKETLRRLGTAGWLALGVGSSPPAKPPKAR